jgi:hypothetical protein
LSEEFFRLRNSYQKESGATVKRLLGVLLLSIGFALSTSQVCFAGPIIWVNDSRGGLGKVDVATGTVTMVGNSGLTLTDIAFDPSGNLYGLSFTTLYQVNTTNAALTTIGAHGINGGNALTFGSDGTLYAAGASPNLYTLNTGNGAGTPFANSMGTNSAGDLAFNGGQLYLAGTNNQLVRLDLSNAGQGTNVGAFGVSSVFGLATASSNGVLYAIAGTNIYTVNKTTGAATFLSDYSGQGLLDAYGAAFFDEARDVPEPASMTILGIGLAGFAAYRSRRKDAVAAAR